MFYGTLETETLSKEAQAATFAKTYGIRQGVVLGGPSLINDTAVRNVLSLPADFELIAPAYGVSTSSVTFATNALN